MLQAVGSYSPGRSSISNTGATWRENRIPTRWEMALLNPFGLPIAIASAFIRRSNSALCVLLWARRLCACVSVCVSFFTCSSEWFSQWESFLTGGFLQDECDCSVEKPHGGLQVCSLMSVKSSWWSIKEELGRLHVTCFILHQQSHSLLSGGDCKSEALRRLRWKWAK